jgi:hypothetical protein
MGSTGRGGEDRDGARFGKQKASFFRENRRNLRDAFFVTLSLQGLFGQASVDSALIE